MKAFKSLVSFVSLLLIVHYSYANDTLSYASPVDHQIRLTGNFMEIRNNHFHSGIDIKSSKGSVGDIIRSVESGFVSRIKIQSGAYGNALYIDHPLTGHTSVYAHLDNFNTEIEAFIKTMQYQLESFEIDIYLPPDKFVIQKREIIGKMGNTGRSFGPHLHFELRNSLTEEALNPEILGIGPEDSRKPVLEKLQVYSIGNSGEIISSESRYFNEKKPNYSLDTNEIESKSNRVAFGLQMYDLMNGSYNKNGIHGYSLYVDDSLYFTWKSTALSFDENNWLNGFIDFEQRKKYGHKTYLLYRQSCNDFSYYGAMDQGIIDLEEKKRRKIRIEVFDIYDNISKLEFDVVKSKKASDTFSEDLISCNRINNYDAGNFDVSFPGHCFFSPMDLKVSKSTEVIDGIEYESLELGNRTTAVSRYYTISTPIIELKNPDKWTFVSTDNNGRYIHFGAKIEEDRLVGHIDQLGEIILYEDLIPPKIDIISMDRSFKSPWKFRISDNLIPDGNVPNLHYRGSINGEWVLLKYDLKNKWLIFDDFDQYMNRSVEFQLLVEDDCGNRAELKRSFK